MATRSDITPEMCREALRYDPATGRLYWRERADVGQRWNTRYAGREAFTSSLPAGYRVGSIFKVRLLAHRVIWAIVTGEWPKGEIDHKNADTTDNRIENLRDVSPAENCRNRGPYSNNVSGTPGVAWHRQHQVWRAYGRKDGRAISLGYYKTKAAAIAARSKFNAENGYEVGLSARDHAGPIDLGHLHESPPARKPRSNICA